MSIKENLEYKMIDKGDMSPPTANDQSNLTAPVLAESHTESEESEEGLPDNNIVSVAESAEGLPSNKIVLKEKEKRAAKVSSAAPHRIVHWQSHLDLLKNNIDTCKECKNPGATLEESCRIGIASTLKINCKKCDKMHDKGYQRYKYLERKDVHEKGKATKDDALNEKKQEYLLET